jgi:small GTP-binding protein
LLGDTNVGKSSFCRRIIDGVFNNKPETTIGIEFQSSMFIINKYLKDYKLKWNIWDTAGQEFYRSLIKSYYRRGVVFILFFDFYNKESFDNLDFWLREIKENCENKHFVYIVGNKFDLNKKNVLDQNAVDYCRSKDIEYFNVSIKNNYNIKNLIDKINSILCLFIFSKTYIINCIFN